MTEETNPTIKSWSDLTEPEKVTYLQEALFETESRLASLERRFEGHQHLSNGTVIVLTEDAE